MGAVMFVLFKSALTSRPLFVNPSLVRTVVDGDQMGQGKISWREPDSNHRSRSCERALGCCRREMPDR
jgi:hypothetical protein